MACVGYVINQYPMPSHTFIRNEILELERQGIRVERFALRGWGNDIVDTRDKQERSRTQYILCQGLLSLIPSALFLIARSPAKFIAAGLNASRLSRGSDRSLLRHFAYLIEACRLARWAEQAGVSHLHAHFGTNAAEVAMQAHLLTDIGYSFTVHGPEEFDKPMQLKLREKASAAKFVVAISSFCQSQLYRWVEFSDWSKIEIVACGLDDTFLEAAILPSPRRAHLVCVGRLCEQKGQLLLLNVIQLVRQRGIDVHLTLVGDGPMRRQIEAAISKLGLDDFVTITGLVSSDRVRAALIEADALVMASFAEGLPVVIMEAMALGRPVVATSIAGVPELIRDGKEGFLVPAGDSDALADAIERLFALPHNELNQIVRQAKERVRERHSIANEAVKLARLFGMSDKDAVS